MLSNLKFLTGQIIRQQNNEYVGEKEIIEWLGNMWGKRPRVVFKKLMKLVWGTFSSHMTGYVKEKDEKIVYGKR